MSSTFFLAMHGDNSVGFAVLEPCDKNKTTKHQIRKPACILNIENMCQFVMYYGYIDKHMESNIYSNSLLKFFI